MSKVDAARTFARQVVEQLHHAGYEAVWAGGCVRDQLLGLSPKDYDVATSATPDEVRQLFGHRRTIPVGASFGVVTLLGPGKVQPMEIATFRSEAGYRDGRHPDQVCFTTAAEDACRRDFTINGLFFNPLTGEVLDYVGGQQDLQAGILRAIGDPSTRLAEDKLRMLRAIRFASRFRFAIDPGTFEAICRHAREIAVVSGERIGMEMQAMLVHPHRSTALALLRESGLAQEVLPEILRLDENAWHERLEVVASLNEPTFATALAAVGYGLFPGKVRETIAPRWKLANRDADRADWLLEQLPVLQAAVTLPWPRLQRTLIHAGAEELLQLATALAGPEEAGVQFCRQQLALPQKQLNPPPLISGEDLIAAGFRPGPQFRLWLEAVRDAQLEQRIHSPEEALALAQQLSRQESPEA